MSIEIPPALQWVSYLAGSKWPQGDEDAMWRVAADWHASGSSMSALVPDLNNVRSETMSVISGETADAAKDAFGQLFDGDYTVDKLAAAMNALGDAAFGVGTEVEAAKLQILIGLAIAAAEIAYAIAMAPWTFGISMLAIPGIEAITLAAVRALISALLKKLLSLALQAMTKTAVKRLVKSAVHEAVEEAAEEFITNLGIQLYQDGKGHRNGLDWKGIGESVGAGAAGGGAAGAVHKPFSKVLGGGQGGIKGIAGGAGAEYGAEIVAGIVGTGVGGGGFDAGTLFAGGAGGAITGGIHGGSHGGTHAPPPPGGGNTAFPGAAEKGPSVEGKIDGAPGDPKGTESTAPEGEPPQSESPPPYSESSSPADKTAATGSGPNALGSSAQSSDHAGIGPGSEQNESQTASKSDGSLAGEQHQGSAGSPAGGQGQDSNGSQTAGHGPGTTGSDGANSSTSQSAGISSQSGSHGQGVAGSHQNAASGSESNSAQANSGAQHAAATPQQSVTHQTSASNSVGSPQSSNETQHSSEASPSSVGSQQGSASESVGSSGGPQHGAEVGPSSVGSQQGSASESVGSSGGPQHGAEVGPSSVGSQQGSASESVGSSSPHEGDGVNQSTTVPPQGVAGSSASGVTPPQGVAGGGVSGVTPPQGVAGGGSGVTPPPTNVTSPTGGTPQAPIGQPAGASTTNFSTSSPSVKADVPNTSAQSQSNTPSANSSTSQAKVNSQATPDNPSAGLAKSSSSASPAAAEKSSSVATPAKAHQSDDQQTQPQQVGPGAVKPALPGVSEKRPTRKVRSGGAPPKFTPPQRPSEPDLAKGKKRDIGGDESWRHHPASNADWFDPLDPALPHAWSARRDGAHVRTVDTEIRDMTADSTPRRPKFFRGVVKYDLRRIEVAPGRAVQEYTVKIHLAPASDNVDSQTIAHAQDKAKSGVDSLLNQGYRLPSGDQFHVNVEFTNNPSEAHTTVRLGDYDNSSQEQWATDENPNVLAHEVLHYLGVPDESHDDPDHDRSDNDIRVFLRHAGNMGVHHNDGGMMGADVHGNDPHLKPRHLWLVERTANSQVAVPTTLLDDSGAKTTGPQGKSDDSTTGATPSSRPAPREAGDIGHHPNNDDATSTDSRHDGSSDAEHSDSSSAPVTSNSKFDALVAKADKAPALTKDNYVTDYLQKSVYDHRPASFVVNMIAPHTDIHDLPGIVRRFMEGTGSSTGKAAFVVGVNAPDTPEGRAALHDKLSDPDFLAQLNDLDHPVALVPSHVNPDRGFQHGVERNNVLHSDANKSAINAMIVDESHPYVAIQDFDHGARTTPSGKHIFDFLADELNIEFVSDKSEIDADDGSLDFGAPSRPLKFAGGYRVPDNFVDSVKQKFADEIARAQAQGDSSQLATLEAASKKVDKKNDFLARFTRAINKDMESRDRLTKNHPSQPYSPEPNLFVDAIAPLVDPQVKFHDGAGEARGIDESLARFHAEELSTAHPIPGELHVNHDVKASPAERAVRQRKLDELQAKLDVDAQNGRHPVRGEAFVARFADGAIETDLARIGMHFARYGNLLQTHATLGHAMAGLLDDPLHSGSSYEQFRKQFPDLGGSQREPTHLAPTPRSGSRTDGDQHGAEDHRSPRGGAKASFEPEASSRRHLGLDRRPVLNPAVSAPIYPTWTGEAHANGDDQSLAQDAEPVAHVGIDPADSAAIESAAVNTAMSGPAASTQRFFGQLDNLGDLHKDSPAPPHHTAFYSPVGNHGLFHAVSRAAGMHLDLSASELRERYIKYMAGPKPPGDKIADFMTTHPTHGGDLAVSVMQPDLPKQLPSNVARADVKTASNAEHFVAKTLAVHLQANVVVHHDDGTRTVFRPFSKKAVESDYDVSTEPDSDASNLSLEINAKTNPTVGHDIRAIHVDATQLPNGRYVYASRTPVPIDVSEPPVTTSEAQLAPPVVSKVHADNPTIVQPTSPTASASLSAAGDEQGRSRPAPPRPVATPSHRQTVSSHSQFTPIELSDLGKPFGEGMRQALEHFGIPPGPKDDSSGKQTPRVPQRVGDDLHLGGMDVMEKFDSGDAGLDHIRDVVIRAGGARAWAANAAALQSKFSDDGLRPKAPGMLRGGKPVSHVVDLGDGRTITFALQIDGKSPNSWLKFEGEDQKYEFEHSSDPTSAFGSFSENRRTVIGGVQTGLSHPHATHTASLFGIRETQHSRATQQADRQISGGQTTEPGSRFTGQVKAVVSHRIDGVLSSHGPKGAHESQRHELTYDTQVVFPTRDIDDSGVRDASDTADGPPRVSETHALHGSDVVTGLRLLPDDGPSRPQARPAGKPSPPKSGSARGMLARLTKSSASTTSPKAPAPTAGSGARRGTTTGLVLGDGMQGALRNAFGNKAERASTETDDWLSPELLQANLHGMTNKQPLVHHFEGVKDAWVEVHAFVEPLGTPLDPTDAKPAPMMRATGQTKETEFHSGHETDSATVRQDAVTWTAQLPLPGRARGQGGTDTGEVMGGLDGGFNLARTTNVANSEQLRIRSTLKNAVPGQGWHGQVRLRFEFHGPKNIAVHETRAEFDVLTEKSHSVPTTDYSGAEVWAPPGRVWGSTGPSRQQRWVATPPAWRLGTGGERTTADGSAPQSRPLAVDSRGTQTPAGGLSGMDRVTNLDISGFPHMLDAMGQRAFGGAWTKARPTVTNSTHKNRLQAGLVAMTQHSPLMSTQLSGPGSSHNLALTADLEQLTFRETITPLSSPSTEVTEGSSTTTTQSQQIYERATLGGRGDVNGGQMFGEGIFGGNKTVRDGDRVRQQERSVVATKFDQKMAVFDGWVRLDGTMIGPEATVHESGLFPVTIAIPLTELHGSRIHDAVLPPSFNRDNPHGFVGQPHPHSSESDSATPSEDAQPADLRPKAPEPMAWKQPARQENPPAPPAHALQPSWHPSDMLLALDPASGVLEAIRHDLGPTLGADTDNAIAAAAGVFGPQVLPARAAQQAGQQWSHDISTPGGKITVSVRAVRDSSSPPEYIGPSKKFETDVSSESQSSAAHLNDDLNRMDLGARVQIPFLHGSGAIQGLWTRSGSPNSVPAAHDELADGKANDKDEASELSAAQHKSPMIPVGESTTAESDQRVPLRVKSAEQHNLFRQRIRFEIDYQTHGPAKLWLKVPEQPAPVHLNGVFSYPAKDVPRAIQGAGNHDSSSGRREPSLQLQDRQVVVSVRPSATAPHVDAGQASTRTAGEDAMATHVLDSMSAQGIEVFGAKWPKVRAELAAHVKTMAVQRELNRKGGGDPTRVPMALKSVPGGTVRLSTRIKVLGESEDGPTGEFYSGAQQFQSSSTANTKSSNWQAYVQAQGDVLPTGDTVNLSLLGRADGGKGSETTHTHTENSATGLLHRKKGSASVQSGVAVVHAEMSAPSGKLGADGDAALTRHGDAFVDFVARQPKPDSQAADHDRAPADGVIAESATSGGHRGLSVDSIVRPIRDGDNFRTRTRHNLGALNSRLAKFKLSGLQEQVDTALSDAKIQHHLATMTRGQEVEVFRQGSLRITGHADVTAMTFIGVERDGGNANVLNETNHIHADQAAKSRQWGLRFLLGPHVELPGELSASARFGGGFVSRHRAGLTSSQGAKVAANAKFLRPYADFDSTTRIVLTVHDGDESHTLPGIDVHGRILIPESETAAIDKTPETRTDTSTTTAKHSDASAERTAPAPPVTPTPLAGLTVAASDRTPVGQTAAPSMSVPHVKLTDFGGDFGRETSEITIGFSNRPSRLRVPPDGWCLLYSVVASAPPRLWSGPLRSALGDPESEHAALVAQLRASREPGQQVPTPAPLVRGAETLHAMVLDWTLQHSADQIPSDIVVAYRRSNGQHQQLTESADGMTRDQLLAQLRHSGVDAVPSPDFLPPDTLAEAYVGQRSADLAQREPGLTESDARQRAFGELWGDPTELGDRELGLGVRSQFQYLERQGVTIGVDRLPDSSLRGLLVHTQANSDAFLHRPLSAEEYAGLLEALRNWRRHSAGWNNDYGEMFAPLVAHTLGIRLRYDNSGQPDVGPVGGSVVDIFYNGSHYDASQAVAETGSGARLAAQTRGRSGARALFTGMPIVDSGRPPRH